MSLLSVLIPAYNNNHVLIRALETLGKQTISADLSIIISDDKSPIPIDPGILKSFSSSFNSLKLTRQKVNLGILSNKEWLYSQVNTDFFAFLEHDDWLISDDFYERAVKLLQDNEKVACFYGNCITETAWKLEMDGSPSSKLFYLSKQIDGETHEVEMTPEHLYLNKLLKYAYILSDNRVTEKLAGVRSDLTIEGKNFVENLSRSNSSRPFVTSWSSLVFKTSSVRKVGGFGGAYTITKAEARSLGIYREEEHFGLLYFLATCYKFQLELEPSITRGWDPKSFSRNFTEHPAKFMKQDCAFYAYYKLAWFISNGFTQNIDKEVIRLLYSFCIRIGLVVQTDASQNFLESYLPAEQEIKEMAQYTINRAKKRFSS